MQNHRFEPGILMPMKYRLVVWLSYKLLENLPTPRDEVTDRLLNPACRLPPRPERVLNQAQLAPSDAPQLQASQDQGLRCQSPRCLPFRACGTSSAACCRNGGRWH